MRKIRKGRKIKGKTTITVMTTNMAYCRTMTNRIRKDMSTFLPFPLISEPHQTFITSILHPNRHTPTDLVTHCYITPYIHENVHELAYSPPHGAVNHVVRLHLST